MLDKAYNTILDVLKNQNVGILIEDDYADFKNFFARSEEPHLEGCITIEFVLMEGSLSTDSCQTIEFYCHFYTSKNRKKQKLLSANDFRRLKNFLDVQIFNPSGFVVTEYFEVKRDYRAIRMSPLFIQNKPGVIIMVGGLFAYNKESGGNDAISTR